MTVSTFRELTTQERELLYRLLEEPFPGQAEIKLQLTHAQVRQIDPDGSLEFRVSSGPNATVTDRVPVVAEYDDDDGVPVQILLHVVDGKISELDIWKGDGSPIRERLKVVGLRIAHAH